MPDQVKVDDLAVLGVFRVALLKFAQAADLSLTNAESEISRTRTWLENEQRNYWEGQQRKRMEAVTRAKEAVRQKKLYKDVSGRTPGAVEEEKALAKCMAALAEAQGKIEAVRKWVPRLEREASTYRGGAARLSRALADDIPRAVALLDRMAASLEEYVQIEAPAPAMPEAPAGPQESVSRGGEAAASPVGGPAPADGDAKPGALPGEKEGGHVGV